MLVRKPSAGAHAGGSNSGMVSGGPGAALVKEAVALSPGKYFISVGFGRGSAYCSQFLPGALYYDQVIAGAKELKPAQQTEKGEKTEKKAA